MKRFILMVWMAGLLIPAGLMAQKVYKEGGKVILDLTEGAGMPAGAITSEAKYTSFTPSDTALGENNDQNGTINATVYEKLEIALQDSKKSNTSGLYYWADAFKACKDLTGWRLPTQRELMLMAIFAPALKDIFSAVGGTNFDSTYYWSATEENKSNSWGVNVPSKYTLSYKKESLSRSVRCVREIK